MILILISFMSIPFLPLYFFFHFYSNFLCVLFLKWQALFCKLVIFEIAPFFFSFFLAQKRLKLGQAFAKTTCTLCHVAASAGSMSTGWTQYWLDTVHGVAYMLQTVICS